MEKKTNIYSKVLTLCSALYAILIICLVFDVRTVKAGTFTGLAERETGRWYYYVDGNIDFDYNGLKQNEAGWWKITNGIVDFNYTGLAYDETVGWWYVENGLINFDYNGLKQNEAGWWYVENGEVDMNQNDISIAGYVGIRDSLSLSRDEVLSDEAKVFIFNIDGEEYELALDTSDDYAIVNSLVPGYNYVVKIENDMVVSAVPVDGENPFSTNYEPLVSASPGEKTVLNLLKTAFGPMGHTLYVYGGGWNFQDEGAGNQTRTIGVSDLWVDFFNNNDEYYSYHDESGMGINYYPENEWNTYFYNGLDCSAFIG